MKPIYKYILISIGVLAVLVYVSVNLWTFNQKSKNVVCKDVVIRFVDNDHRQLLTTKDVIRILEERNIYPIGKKIKGIKTESIEKQLKSNEMIDNAIAYKTPSGKVQIIIYQRLPKFRVCTGFENYYIDSNRKIMPLTSQHAPYLPIVSGRISKSRATGVMYDFVRFLEEHPFWNAQIVQIYVREDLKVELVPRVGDAIIVLGTLDNFEKKLGKLEKLYTKGFSYIGWNKYQIIDLQYKDQIVCTKVGSVHNNPTKPVIKNKTDSVALL
jgi:cell division protein FtsQ